MSAFVVEFFYAVCNNKTRHVQTKGLCRAVVSPLLGMSEARRYLRFLYNSPLIIHAKCVMFLVARKYRKHLAESYRALRQCVM